MTVFDLLDRHRDDIVREALESLGRRHLKHYEAEGETAARERLQRLFDLSSVEQDGIELLLECGARVGHRCDPVDDVTLRPQELAHGILAQLLADFRRTML